jgi:hypothetical protein
VTARIQAGDLAGALQHAGLDLAAWAEVGKRWGDALADDSALAAQFRRRMAAEDRAATGTPARSP